MVVESCLQEDYPKFGKLPGETMREKARKIIGWIWESEAAMPRNRLAVSDDCISSIIDLVERRRIYFHVFHGINMSEWNEIALYCFWIAKLQPFFEIPPPDAKARQANEVNAVIAVRTLYNAANKIRREQGKERIKQMGISNLIHAFRYRDISKEAVMAIFENLISA